MYHVLGSVGELSLDYVTRKIARVDRDASHLRFVRLFEARLVRDIAMVRSAALFLNPESTRFSCTINLPDPPEERALFRERLDTLMSQYQTIERAVQTCYATSLVSTDDWVVIVSRPTLFAIA